MARSSKSSRGTWAALLAVAGIVIALLWIAQAIVAHNRLQNCLDSGRRDCVPLSGTDP